MDEETLGREPFAYPTQPDVKGNIKRIWTGAREMTNGVNDGPNRIARSTFETDNVHERAVLQAFMETLLARDESLVFPPPKEWNVGGDSYVANIQAENTPNSFTLSVTHTSNVGGARSALNALLNNLEKHLLKGTHKFWADVRERAKDIYDTAPQMQFDQQMKAAGEGRARDREYFKRMLESKGLEDVLGEEYVEKAPPAGSSSVGDTVADDASWWTESLDKTQKQSLQNSVSALTAEDIVKGLESEGFSILPEQGDAFLRNVNAAAGEATSLEDFYNRVIALAEEAVNPPALPPTGREIAPDPQRGTDGIVDEFRVDMGKGVHEIAGYNPAEDSIIVTGTKDAQAAVNTIMEDGKVTAEELRNTLNIKLTTEEIAPQEATLEDVQVQAGTPENPQAVRIAPPAPAR